MFCRAGSRYELPDNLGITHILRSGAVLSTQELTSFSLHRVPSQMGFNLYASVDREAFTYSVEAHPNAMYEYLSNPRNSCSHLLIGIYFYVLVPRLSNFCLVLRRSHLLNRGN